MHSTKNNQFLNDIKTNEKIKEEENTIAPLYFLNEKGDLNALCSFFGNFMITLLPTTIFLSGLFLLFFNIYNVDAGGKKSYLDDSPSFYDIGLSLVIIAGLFKIVYQFFQIIYYQSQKSIYDQQTTVKNEKTKEVEEIEGKIGKTLLSSQVSALLLSTVVAFHYPRAVVGFIVPNISFLALEIYVDHLNEGKPNYILTVLTHFSQIVLLGLTMEEKQDGLFEKLGIFSGITLAVLLLKFITIKYVPRHDYRKRRAIMFASYTISFLTAFYFLNMHLSLSLLQNAFHNFINIFGIATILKKCGKYITKES